MFRVAEHPPGVFAQASATSRIGPSGRGGVSGSHAADSVRARPTRSARKCSTNAVLPAPDSPTTTTSCAFAGQRTVGAGGQNRQICVAIDQLHRAMLSTLKALNSMDNGIRIDMGRIKT